MPAIAIRQSGGANIVSLPKAILKTLGLHVGSKLELSLDENKIVLTPVEQTLTLETLLENSPKKHFHLTEEDREWLNMKPAGNEIS